MDASVHGVVPQNQFFPACFVLNLEMPWASFDTGITMYIDVVQGDIVLGKALTIL